MSGFPQNDIRRKGRPCRAERGFTFLELAIAMAVMAMILPVLVTSARQITWDTDRNVTRITALTTVESAIFRLGREVPIAQATDLADPTVNATSITVYWTDWTDASNYNSYSATDIAYKRVRATYSVSGTNLVRTTATCFTQTSSDVTCSVPTSPCTPAPSGIAVWNNNTKWVAGEPVLDSNCVYRAASRVADPASPATVSRYVATATFSRSGSTFTIKLKAQPKTADQPAEERTYTIIGPLLTAPKPL